MITSLCYVTFWNLVCLLSYREFLITSIDWREHAKLPLQELEDHESTPRQEEHTSNSYHIDLLCVCGWLSNDEPAFKKHFFLELEVLLWTELVISE